MPQFLSNLTAVLGELESFAEEVDMLVGRLLTSGDRPGSPDICALQRVDLLFQSLTAVRQIVANAERQGIETLDLDAELLTEGVLLESIRRKCATVEPSVEPEPTLDDLIF